MEVRWPQKVRLLLRREIAGVFSMQRASRFGIRLDSCIREMPCCVSRCNNVYIYLLHLSARRSYCIPCRSTSLASWSQRSSPWVNCRSSCLSGTCSEKSCSSLTHIYRHSFGMPSRDQSGMFVCTCSHWLRRWLHQELSLCFSQKVYRRLHSLILQDSTDPGMDQGTASWLWLCLSHQAHNTWIQKYL